MPRTTSPSRIGQVRINGALFYAYHGVSEGEHHLGTQYEVDVEVTGDFAVAAASDKLQDAFNYEAIYSHVQAIMLKRRYRLMESIASRIMDDLFAKFPAAIEISVSVRKLNAPIKGIVHSAEVSLTIARSQWRKLH